MQDVSVKAVPLTKALLDVARLLLTTRQLVLAEAALQSAVPTVKFEGLWRSASRARFFSPMVAKALATAGVPQNEQVFAALMKADSWPAEVFETHSDALADRFVFDQTGDGVVDMAQADKNALLKQVPSFLPVFSQALHDEYAKQRQLQYPGLRGGGQMPERLPDDKHPFWESANCILQDHPFILAVQKLPVDQGEEVMNALGEAFIEYEHARCEAAIEPQQRQYARQRG